MTKKLLLSLAMALVSALQLNAQPGSTSTASTSADIVEGVGTGPVADEIRYVYFLPGGTPRPGGKQAGQSFGVPLLQRENAAFFQVLGSQNSYTISTAFDTKIPHSLSPGPSIKIASIQVLPVSPVPGGPATGDWHRLELVLEPEAGQAPGHYQSKQPGRITIHFN